MDRYDSGSRDGAFDWDAAFDAIVAPLREPRYLRIARAAGATLVAVLLVLVTWLVLAQIVIGQTRGLSYPMR